MKGVIAVMAMGACLAISPAHGQDAKGAAAAAGEAAAKPADIDKVHDELRALRDGLVEATNASNMEALLPYLHKNVVVTWQNGEVSVGPEAVRDYLMRMRSGPNPIVKCFHTSPTVDALTTLYGEDTGVAYGNSRDHFVLNDGRDFELTSRWTITMVREGGRWLVASFHASVNMFDNPILDMAKRAVKSVGLGAFVAGVAIGALGSVLFRRRRAVPA
jgi:ketosteroid isomerase-like protein